MVTVVKWSGSTGSFLTEGKIIQSCYLKPPKFTRRPWVRQEEMCFCGIVEHCKRKKIESHHQKEENVHETVTLFNIKYITA